MPIEVRELVIRTEVEASSQAGGGGGSESSDKQALIQECVEQVLENARAMEFGPLSDAQVSEIQSILDSFEEG